MRGIGHFVFVRHRHNWGQLIRFGMVGGSGMLVNMLVVIILKKTGPDYTSVFFDLPFTVYNVRWYHVIVTIAFLVANFWNFWINRRWTFRSSKHASWYAEYPPFLAVGGVGQVVSLGLVTALIHPDSIISLPETVFDDSTGFRTKLYWAQLIAIVLVFPVTFVVNKLWTFSAVRRGKQLPLVPIDQAQSEDPAAESTDPADSDGRPTSSDGHSTSSDGHSTSSDGHSTSSDGHSTNSDGHPADSDDHPAAEPTVGAAADPEPRSSVTDSRRAS